MKKSKILLLIIAALAAAGVGYVLLSRPHSAIAADENEIGPQPFDDGLTDAVERTEGKLNEFGEGIVGTEVFRYAGNIKITKSRFENGTAHGRYEYKVELNGKDITPENFSTVEGADCALQRLRFFSAPEFHVVKISRQWEETWITPTMATKTIYRLSNDGLKAGAPEDLEIICDVSDLF